MKSVGSSMCGKAIKHWMSNIDHLQWETTHKGKNTMMLQVSSELMQQDNMKGKFRWNVTTWALIFHVWMQENMFVCRTKLCQTTWAHVCSV